MKLSPRKIILILLKFFFISCLLLTSYYFFIIKPHFAVANALLQIESEITALQANLIQTRLALIKLQELDPQSPTAETETGYLVESLRNSEVDVYERLSNLDILKIKTPPTPEFEFIRSKLPDELNGVGEYHQTLIIYQGDLVHWFETDEGSLEGLADYEPSVEDLIKQQKQVIDEYDLLLDKISQVKADS